MTEAGESTGGRRRLRRGRLLAAGAALVLASGVPRCPSDGAGPAAGADHGPPAAAPAASGEPPPELRAVAERAPGLLPAHARLDRLVVTPHHVVLGGVVPDLDGVADLIESLARIPGIEEPELRRAVASQRGVEIGIVLAVSPSPSEIDRDEREPPPPPAYASLPVRRALFRWLFPPST